MKSVEHTTSDESRGGKKSDLFWDEDGWRHTAKGSVANECLGGWRAGRHMPERMSGKDLSTLKTLSVRNDTERRKLLQGRRHSFRILVHLGSSLRFAMRSRHQLVDLGIAPQQACKPRDNQGSLYDRAGCLLAR